MSERAHKILTLLNASPTPLFIRQQSLADQFNCSRRTIGRALKELKEAGLLVDLNQRHENRCKIYEIKQITPLPKGEGLGEQQLKLFRFTFESNFRDWPDWEKYYPQVTWELRRETNMDRLWRQTFDKLYVIRDSI